MELPHFMSNFFIEDSRIFLSNLKVGCYLNDVCFSGLSYADDSIVLTPQPSTTAHQIIIDVCASYEKHIDMICNMKKCYCREFTHTKCE